MLSCTVPTTKIVTPDLTITLQQKIKQYLIEEYQYASGGQAKKSLMYFVGGNSLLNMKFIITISQPSDSIIQINLVSLQKEQSQEYINKSLSNIKEFISTLIQ